MRSLLFPTLFLAISFCGSNSSAYMAGIGFFQKKATPNPSYVQSQGDSIASNTVTIAYPSPVTAGNTLIACVGGNVGASNPVATDTQSNTWTRVFNINGGTSNANFACFYAANANAGATTVTLGDTSTGTHSVGTIFEVDRIVTTAPLDAWGTSIDDEPALTSTATTSTSVTQAKGYTFVICLDYDEYQTWSLSANHTVRQQIQGNIGQYIMVAGEGDVKIGRSGTLSHTCTRSSAAVAGFMSAIMFFKAQ